MISTVFFQPLILGLAASLMIAALVYQKKKDTCGDKTVNWGKEVFNMLMGMGIVVVIIAVMLHIVMAFTGNVGKIAAAPVANASNIIV